VFSITQGLGDFDLVCQFKSWVQLAVVVTTWVADHAALLDLVVTAFMNVTVAPPEDVIVLSDKGL
tara:strand:+ start:349 stop:543 length:195 start_codon:yes stop_codon:yes gene_type:complete